MALSIIQNQLDETLIDMLKKVLPSDEQQQFVLNFQLYLTYGNDDTKFVVDLDNIWEWLGSSTKASAKRSILKYFEEAEDYIVVNSVNTHDTRVHGGQNKEQILMNVNTFKSLCMMSNTNKGKETRKYYSKMETVFFKYLEQQNKDVILKLQADAKHAQKLAIHNRLIASHKDTPCIYILLVYETDDKNGVVKLGETDNIQIRITSLRQEYKDSFLLNIFPCQRPHKFEQYLLHRNDIIQHKLMGTEMIQISDDFTYENLLKIIQKNIDMFDCITPDMKIQMATLKCQEQLHKEKQNIIDMINAAPDDQTKLKLIDILDKIVSQSVSPLSVDDIDIENDKEVEERPLPMTDRRVFKYNVSELTTPVESFYSLKEAARSLKNPNMHDYHIRNACLNNTVFNDFRWSMVDGSTEAPSSIPPTAEEKVAKPPRRSGLIAQINTDNTQILNVYPNQKIAGENTKIAACSITIAIKLQKKSGGFLCSFYDDCSEALKKTYTGELPDKHRALTCSKKIQRVDPVTNEVVETYTCMQDVCSIYKTCHKTIHKVSKSGDIYRGFKWIIT